MSARFERTAAGTPVVLFDEYEASIIRTLLVTFLHRLAAEDKPGPDDPLARELGIGGSEKLPDDPVLARLFPDAYQDDPSAASDFRRYTEQELREGKRAKAQRVLRDLDRTPEPITLDPDGAAAWLGVLNDLRLALGTDLEVTQDLDEFLATIPKRDPRRALAIAYEWLGILQATLIETLQGDVEDFDVD